MTDRQIRSLISKMNNHKTRDIFVRPLCENVDLAKVFRKPSLAANFEPPHTFYFIKNETGTYVAAVLQMSTNLHWFVVPHHRGKGILTKALKEAILNHLCRDRNDIEISINPTGDYFEASEKVALSVGFKKVGDSDRYVLNEENCTFLNVDGFDTAISTQRFDEIRFELSRIYNSLQRIESEIQMKLDHTDFCEEICYIKQEVRRSHNNLTEMRDFGDY